MARSNFSIGRVFLQIALGLMMLVGGILVFQGGGDIGATALGKIFKGETFNIIKIVYGIIELIAGIFLILDLIIGDRLGAFGTILMVILIVIWIAVIVLCDFIGVHFNSKMFLGWLYQLANHLIVLGALIYLRF
ncbi:MAG: hypothetical protein MJ174_04820 [Treponema sp.]|nr:hypothetical protein [Treponema sp.]